MVSLEIERILGTQFQISLKWENTKCFFQLFWPLVQWLANFCKSPISKCFRFCQPDDLCGNYSNGYSATVAWMQAQTTCKGMGVVTIGLQASLCSRLKTTVAEPQPTTTHGSWLGSGLRAVRVRGETAVRHSGAGTLDQMASASARPMVAAVQTKEESSETFWS